MAPKKSKQNKFEPKQMVLAKMSGWSAWPSFVMPAEMIPDAVMKVKKKTTEYCVIFIPDGDYYWMTEKNLESLTEEKLNKKLEKIPHKAKGAKKGRTLNVSDALLVAKDTSFDEFMDTLDVADPASEAQQDDEELELDEDADQVEDGEGDDIKEEESEVKEEVEDTKQPLSDEDDESKDSDAIVNGSKRKHANTRNGNGRVSKNIANRSKANDKNGNGASKAKELAPKVLTEEEKQHQLWLCRIKLQRSLIQRNQPVTPSDPSQFPPPSADELSVSRLILHRLVDFPVTVDLLKRTKIHKVLKCILKDNDLEYPDSFKLHEKCHELLEKWDSIIESIKLEKSSKSTESGDEESAPAKKKQKRPNDESRLSSQAPDDSEISGLETNSTVSSSTDTGKVFTTDASSAITTSEMKSENGSIATSVGS